MELLKEIADKLYKIHFHKGDELEAVVELNQAIKVVKEVTDSYVIKQKGRHIEFIKKEDNPF